MVSAKKLITAPVIGNSRPDAYVESYGLATPPHVSTQQLARNFVKLQRSAGKDAVTIAKQNKLLLVSGILHRSMSLAYFHEGSDSAGEFFLGKPVGEAGPFEQLEAGRSVLTAEQRAALWGVIAPALCEQAARQALENWRGGSASDITHIVLANTSGWQEPGLAAHLIHSLDLPLNTAKAELNFNGCFAGMTCLRLARDIVRAGDVSERPRVVLVVAVEVPSVHVDFSAEDGGSLVANALFSDGAAAFVVAAAGEWQISAAGMELIPDSTHLLGMHPHSSPGYKPPRQSYEMKLDRGVPDALGSYFSGGGGGQQLLSKVLW